MTVSKKEIEHIAQLARFRLSDAEKEKFSQEISVILGYVDQIGALKTGPVPDNNRNRKKVAGQNNDISHKYPHPEAILKNAPRQKNNYIEVKNIL